MVVFPWNRWDNRGCFGLSCFVNVLDAAIQQGFHAYSASLCYLWKWKNSGMLASLGGVQPEPSAYMIAQPEPITYIFWLPNLDRV